MSSYKVAIKRNIGDLNPEYFYVVASNIGKAYEGALTYIKKTWYVGARAIVAIEYVNTIVRVV